MSGLAGTASAQKSIGDTARKREQEKVKTTHTFEDELELKVIGVETSVAVKKTGEESHEDAEKEKIKDPLKQLAYLPNGIATEPERKIDITG